MIDIHDDLATAKKPFRVIAPIPVFGRVPLLRQTISRLYKKNGVDKVICVGDGIEEREVCESSGALWVSHPNKPLGAKWNAGFYEAKQFNPDAVVFIGSSDWISDNWIQELQQGVERFDFVGTLGCHFADIRMYDKRVCYWPGYVGARAGETIGLGRMLSKRLMDMLAWQPFNGALDSSLDGSMKDKILKFGITNMEVSGPIKSLSISTIQWKNLHQFSQHWFNHLPSQRLDNAEEFLKTNFPEAFKIFE